MAMSGDEAYVLSKKYTEATALGLGAVKGKDGFSPIITENQENTDKVYRLDIATQYGTFTTPNLKGGALQSKTVTPASSDQTVFPDKGYDYLSSVTVKSIPYTETENPEGGITVTIGS